jgi:hypothetical protein
MARVSRRRRSARKIVTVGLNSARCYIRIRRRPPPHMTRRRGSRCGRTDSAGRPALNMLIRFRRPPDWPAGDIAKRRDETKKFDEM